MDDAANPHPDEDHGAADGEPDGGRAEGVGRGADEGRGTDGRAPGEGRGTDDGPAPRADGGTSDAPGTADAHAAEVARREADDARKEAEALRRDREKSDRAAAKEADRARRDREKAERDAAKDADRARKEADRRRRDDEKAERDRLKALQQAEAARERALQDVERERVRRETEARREAERAQAERERAARDAAREAGRALREAEKAARDAALAQQRAAREAEKARREAARAETAPPTTTVDASALPPDLAVLWRSPEPPRRGPRPSLTLDQIADAAIALADAEGIGAVSMARLAESLGFTTMSLYRYVSSKDEVVSLMADRASGRPPVVGREVGDWRARVELLVSIQQPVLFSHPWLAQTGTVLHAVGPNRLAWMEAMVAALEDTPLDEATKVAAVGTLASHQLDELRLFASWTDRERAVQEATSRSYDMDGMLLAVATPDEHPALVRAATAGAFGSAMDDGPVSFGTTLLLDGIAALVARAEGRAGA